MRRTQRARGQRRGQRGQSLVEFALILPLFFILLFGIIDIGRLFSTDLTLQNALRQAGRYAVTGNPLTNATLRVDLIKQAAVQASGGLVTTGDVQMNPSNAGGPSDTVTITITHKLSLITPFIRQFFSDGVYTIEARASFRNEPFPTGRTY